MPTLAEVRQQFPQYSDMSDAALADALHSKFYADMPRADFDQKIGYSGKVTLGDVGSQALKDIKAIPGKIGGLISDVVNLPSRAGGAVQQYEQTGEYNPAPFMEAATLASPANPAMRAGDKIVPGAMRAMKADKKPVPTANQLMEQADVNYGRARTSGVEFNPETFKNWAAGVQQELENAGRIDAPSSAPDTHALLRKLQSPPAGSTQTIANIDAFRQSLSDIAFDPRNKNSERAAASIALKKLDEFIPGIGQEGVVAGAAALPYALEQIGKGRANFAAAKRSNIISGDLDAAHTGILERADDRAAAANSGQNVGNALRQRIASLLANKKELGGFSPAEISQAERITQGTKPMNYSRGVANFMGGGGGLGANFTSTVAASIGALLGGVPGAALGATAGPTIGLSAKATENALTRRQVNKLDEMFRKRSPIYEDAPQNYSAISPEKRAAIVRLLLLEQQQQ